MALVRLLRPVQTTVAPASPKAAAMPRPAPRVAPATTATRPRSASRFGDHATARVCQLSSNTTNGHRGTPLRRARPSQGPLVEAPALHDDLEVVLGLQDAQVPERVARDDDEVGVFSRLDGADPIGHPEELGIDPR